MRRWLHQWLSYFSRKPSADNTIPSTIYLPKDVAEATAQLVASFGTSYEQHEGIVYWAGVPVGQGWIVTTVLVPQAITTPGSFRTSAVANAQVIAKVNQFRLQLFAQIHGHPSDWVDHSAGDNQGAFMPYFGFYSIVVPWYGQQGILPLSGCGIHRYENSGFRRLTPKEISHQFVIVPAIIDLRR